MWAGVGQPADGWSLKARKGFGVFRLIGSLKIAVVLLIAIAAVLAWGTIYEVRYGTAAVQQFVYTSWWFQGLLGFLALNLATAALQRWPWQRRHIPFVLAHIGIILILVGGIIGGRYGIDGQLIIPEGQSADTLVLPRNVLVVHAPGSDAHQIIPTSFEAQAWVHEPHTVFPVTLGDRSIRLTVDRYYPDATTAEEIVGGGSSSLLQSSEGAEQSTEENPAVQLRVEHVHQGSNGGHAGQDDTVWLLARDPQRWIAGWGASHLVFVEPQSDEQMALLLGRAESSEHPRGVLSIEIPSASMHEVPVPEIFGEPVAIGNTSYRVAFKEYFPDFVIGEQGPTSRSRHPNNPAVAFVLIGPEGEDPHLVFALHPDFQSMHGLQHTIPARVRYHHPASAELPPNAFAVVKLPSGDLAVVMTGASGERQVLEKLEVGARYEHPWTGDAVQVMAYHPRAVIERRIANRGNEVKAEMLHLVAREGEREASAWVPFRGTVELAVGSRPIVVEYRPAEWTLPFRVVLRDFRKIDYPGTQMAAGFESDIELIDPARSVTIARTISMNNPLKHRGFSLFQSSYAMGATETTILSVRNDPGTGLVYAGFLTVVAGIVSLFALRNRRAGK